MAFQEIQEAVESINRDFVEFKAKNDERLQEIEKKGSSDPLLDEQVEKIQAAIHEIEATKAQVEELAKKSNRFGSNGENEQEIARKEYSSSFDSYMRKGDDSNLKELSRKDMSAGSNANGGYAIPEQLDRTIYDLVQQVSPMRRIATVRRIGGVDYKKLVNTHGTSSGWVGETASRSNTNTPQLVQLTPSMGEIYAFPKTTQRALDDVFFNIESFLQDEVGTEFAIKEGQAFINGDGVDKPLGFLAASTPVATGDESRAFGVLQYVPTGVAGGWPTAAPADILKDLRGAIKTELEPGSQWVMNKSTKIAIEKFKDGNGQYLWRPSLEAGEPSTFDGYSVVEVPHMPDVAGDSFSVAFGNFKRGFEIVDRIGIRTIRDDVTDKPYVGFYTTMRVGSMLLDSTAIKLLKFSAS